MRSPRLCIALSIIGVICVLAILTPRMRALELVVASTNSPPVAGADTFTGLAARHQLAPGVLGNDSDPDNDPLFVSTSLVTSPQHGYVNLYGDGGFDYSPNSTYDDTDSFTYQVCDDNGNCADGVVTLADANHPPSSETDTFNALGARHQDAPGVLANDSDVDGDSLHLDLGFNYQAQHGYVTLYGDGSFFYGPANGYVGSDTFSYRLCDQFESCTVASVTLTNANTAPVAAPDLFFGRPSAFQLPAGVHNVLANDSDAEGDQLNVDLGTSGGGTQHNGYVNIYGGGDFYYTPPPNFIGTDTFTYNVCDSLGACSTGTVTLLVIGDGVSRGVCLPCSSGAIAVGGPVNVTNGNMYLRQGDYQLPGVGPAIDLTRTYNSDSQELGLFGRGWSTGYDQSIVAYDNNLARLNESDGRATYFGRQPGLSGAFPSLEGDFHGSLVQNGSNGFTLTMTDSSVRQFNATGKLISLTDRLGNQTTLAYDTGGKLASVTDSFGRLLSFTTNVNGQVLSIADTLGTIATYTYGGSNELLSVTYADNSAFQFGYDGNYRLTTVTDALGNIVESHTYDGFGRAITSEKQGGVEHYSLDYVSDTETDVTDALSHVTKYTVDKSKGRNLVTRIEGLCTCGGGSQVQTRTYDDQLNLIAKSDALNRTITFTYDANGNRLSQTDATGTAAFTYNQFGEVLTATDQMGGLTTLTYDAQGNLLTVTNPLGKTTGFTSDSRGQLLSVTDARGKLTTFAYDSSGHLITATDALNHATQYGYDARSRLTSMTNALGHSTGLAYDSVGRPIQVTQADGSTINYEYDRGGRLTAMIDAKGNRSTYAYDGAGRLTVETDALSQSTSYGYDLMSNLISGTDALGRVTNYEYDDFNRLKKIIYPPATAGATRLFETVGYDAAGNVVNRTDTAGRATSFAYDDVDRVVSTTDAANKVTRFEYDPLGRTTALVDALSQRYRFNYDAAGRLRHVRRGTTVMSFTYDAVGNRKRRTDYNGALTTYNYDALNRLKTINYPDTTTVNYTYDKLSRLQTATNENGVVNFDYNKMNRMTSVTDVFGQVVDYNYDANGNRTKLNLNGAVVETYRYDAIDRLTKILDAASATFNFTYDQTNKLTSQKAPNGVTATYQYDGLVRLTRLTNKKGQTTVADFQYQFNDANNISQITELASINNYSYDAVDRLAAATHSSQPNESYGYDGVGNRTSSSLSATYGYQPFNRLISTASATYSYDPNGNLISKTSAGGTTQFSWDFENRLRQATLPNGRVVTYKYDALGRRIERGASAPSSPTITERYIYDGADVIRDIDGNGVTLADYLNGPGIDNKLRQTTATGSLYYVQDHLGSTRALTDASGNVVEQQQYDSFGNGNGSTRTRYGYTGRERDPDTGLLYYRARFYDAQLGRFISEDPIGLAGGINSFAYASNNPIGRRDPTGLYDIDSHYYLTYYLALKTGCFSDADARLIAQGNQDSDESDWKKPQWGNSIVVINGQPTLVPDPGAQYRNEAFHAFGTPAQNLRRAQQLLSQAYAYGGNPFLFGTYLHFRQDSYSHRDFAGNTTYGQLPGGNAVDHTNFDPKKAMDMAHATFDDLQSFGRQRGCKCNGEPDWKAVQAFISVGYVPGDPFDFAWHVTDAQLRTKIKILGVPWRSPNGR